MKKRIAVIGGGIAGLVAAYLLHRRHDITLFEKTHRLGGNAYTFDTRDGHAPDIAVAAFGKAGYPLFYRLLDELRIGTDMCPSSYMSFHNLDTRTGLYVTPGLRGLMAQGFGLLNPKRLKSFADVLSGVAEGRRRLATGRLADLTLAEALADIPALRGDARLIFLCALCLMSSMDAPDILASPAWFFFEKLAVHHDVVSPRAVYSVRCVQGGTRRYVDALAATFRDRIELNSSIRAVTRSDDAVTLVMADGERRTFDHVVFACNADQALALLEKPTDDERRLLGAWRYRDGRVVVHTDASSFPARELTQAYTFLYTERDGVFQTSVNGALWHEPQMPDDSPYFSSQHPNFPIRPETIELDTILRTPIFDAASCPTIRELPSLNGGRTWYCGSHFGHGLHEDAVASAVAVADALGVPFVFGKSV